MEQNDEIIIDSETLFEKVASALPEELGLLKQDEVERLISQQYPWQLNDVEKIYSGIITKEPESEEEKRTQTERQSFLAWLADKPQRVYIMSAFEDLLQSYSQLHKLRELLEAFYNGGEYEKMTEELMKYEDRATEIPLIMVVDNQEKNERIVHSEIRKVWFPKLNKKKSVIVVVIDKSKLMSMEQE